MPRGLKRDLFTPVLMCYDDYEDGMSGSSLEVDPCKIRRNLMESIWYY